MKLIDKLKERVKIKGNNLEAVIEALCDLLEPEKKENVFEEFCCYFSDKTGCRDYSHVKDKDLYDIKGADQSIFFVLKHFYDFLSSKDVK